MGDQQIVEGAGKGLRWKLGALLSLLFSVALTEAKEDSGSLWVSAYGWIQTGDRLASAKLWPLAIGSYIEADRQIKALAVAYPAFEPDIIGYRLKKLQTDIETAQKNLTTGEHDIMMKYLDFIESFELGKKQRYGNEFEDSLTTLSEARSLLDELIEEKPDEFEVAVKTQHELLDDSIDWLYSQVDFKRQTSRVVSVGDGYDWGNTQYVKASDLPSSKDPVEPFGGLFPEVSVRSPPVVDEAKGESGMSVGADKVKNEEEEADAKSVGRLRFRMNSQSEAVAGERDEEDD